MSLAITGCGYRRPPQVKRPEPWTLDGEPVAEASLTFIPDSGRPAMAVTNADGEFQVSSFGGNDGLPAGSYRVIAIKEVLKEKFQKLYEKQVAQAKADAEPGRRT